MQNKERYIIDSNIFYALFVSDDTLHDDAMTLFVTLDDSELIVTYGVVQEVATLLTYRKGKNIADIFVQHLLDAGNMMLFSGLPEHDMREFLTHDKKMGFVDYSLLTIALEQGIQLISFDKQLIHYYDVLIGR